MTLPFQLPTWIPWWLFFAALALGVLYVLAFLVMPFSVFGLKGRMEGIEARLDEIQMEMRRLTLRLPDLPGNGQFEEEPLALPLPPGRWAAETRGPPIPPAPHIPSDEGPPGSATGRVARRERDPRAMRARTEPRIDWPQ